MKLSFISLFFLRRDHNKSIEECKIYYALQKTRNIAFDIIVRITSRLVQLSKLRTMYNVCDNYFYMYAIKEIDFVAVEINHFL